MPVMEPTYPLETGAKLSHGKCAEFCAMRQFQTISAEMRSELGVGADGGDD